MNSGRISTIILSSFYLVNLTVGGHLTSSTMMDWPARYSCMYSKTFDLSGV